MVYIPIYILILGFTIVIDYFAGIYIEISHGRRRKLYLIISLIANIGVLVFFKYYNFLNDSLTSVLHGAGSVNPIPKLDIILPIGLSFHTFQAMSYTIEVFRGNQKAERHFGIYSLYVMFFPQLVAGPIERPQNLLHQFYENHKFECKRVVSGLKLMLWGLFMKLVIADRLGIFVDAVYENSMLHSGKTLALATFFFSIQIYCDFAGYSNIAIGSARVLGFDLMTNFNRPYFARSVSEFWRRWHISLSTWFKDYLFISMGGNRVGAMRLYSNLLTVFLISGLWHGANWTFLIWGGLNGCYLILESFLSVFSHRCRAFFHLTPIGALSVLKIFITYSLIGFSWIFFRCKTAEEGLHILERICRFEGDLFYDSPSTILFCILSILILFTIETILEIKSVVFIKFWEARSYVRYLFYVGLVILILTMGVFDGGQFIYFQF